MYSASLFYLFMGHLERKIKVCHAITGFCQRSPTSAYVDSFSFLVDLLKSKRTQIALVVLIIQNSTLVLMMHYSRIIQDPEQPMYIASTAVFMAELIKIAACLIAIMHENGQDRFVQVLYRDLFCQPKELLKMLVPSGLYAIQNNLLYIALSNLEAATFQVTYQLKILSTAIFSVLLLGTALTKQKWLALLLLMIGVTLVQLPTSTSSTASSEKHNGSTQNQTVGLLAVMASCVSSGFAGCYFEKILKSSNTSMWIRNIQLGISGAIFSFIAVMAYDYPRIAEGGMFQGYGLLTCLVVINQALGGLLVSLVVRYADNILKGFATSLSIILSSVISFKLFDFQPSYHFIFGAMLVMVSC
jgi:UDP-sugar transporter A1/2/3